MNTLPFYKRIVGVGMIAVLACSVLLSNPRTTLAQNLEAPEEGTNETVVPAASTVANPNAATDAVETSVNTGSRNNPRQDGGSGDALTDFAWKMLMPWYWVQTAMKILGNTILMMFGWALGLVGLIFNFIIDKTIVNLKSTIDSLGIITDIWKVIRDFINLFFIFALLYAAVGTILGLEKVNWKSTVSNLILAALLINFSLFITKAALDLSNIVTIGFYTQLPGVGATDINPTNLNAASKPGGISNSIMQSLKLETIYKPNYNGGSISGVAGGLSDANRDSVAGSFAYILATVMGSIFICVTMVVMVAACWLFLKRFIDIIFLMIRSPIAFAGYVLPQLDEYQKNWWTELKANVVFPPVYMAMMWITFKILQSPGFQTIAPGSNGFGEAFTSLGPTTINIVFRFVVVIAMMVYALKSASKVGVEGGEMFTDFLKEKKGQLQGAVTGAIGRNTLGRAAAAVRDSNVAKNIEAFSPTAGRLLNSNLKNVAGASFGGAKGGFDSAVKQAEKDAKEGYGRVSKAAEWREPAPYKRTWESDTAFAARTAEYKAKKDKFEEEAKKSKEQRQKDYVEALRPGVPVLPDMHIGSDGIRYQPYRVGEGLRENVAAVSAVEKQVKEDKKKEEKKAEQEAIWEKEALNWVNRFGAEMRASLDPTASVEKPTFDPGNKEHVEWAGKKQSIATQFDAKIKEIADATDKKKKIELLEKLREQYQEMEDKFAEDEVEVLEKVKRELELTPRTSPTHQKLLEQKLRIEKSQKARAAAAKKLEAIENRKERAEEKEQERKEREDKEKKESGGGGGGESKKTK